MNTLPIDSLRKAGSGGLCKQSAEIALVFKHKIINYSSSSTLCPFSGVIEDCEFRLLCFGDKAIPLCLSFLSSRK